MGIFSGVGASPTFNSASGGKVYAYNTINDTTLTQVAPANTDRRRITFHNPGTIDVYIVPQYVQTTGSNVANTVAIGALGGALLVFANGGTLVIEGECQGAWEALSASGSGNPLTIVDNNL